MTLPHKNDFMQFSGKQERNEAASRESVLLGLVTQTSDEKLLLDCTRNCVVLYCTGVYGFHGSVLLSVQN